MKKSTLTLGALVLTLGVMVACESKVETDTNPPKENINESLPVAEPTDEDKSTDKESTTDQPDADTSTGNEVIKEAEEPALTPIENQNGREPNSMLPGDDVKIPSGDAAIQYLKHNLKDGMNEDIAYGTDGILEQDDNGSYYTVRLVSISLRLAGGTGSLDTYRVYQDGTHKGY